MSILLLQAKRREKQKVEMDISDIPNFSLIPFFILSMTLEERDILFSMI